VAPRIHWLGFREDIPELMAASDIVLHTSVAPEPFGRVIVEAMLARRPVVATLGGGAEEIIQTPETGVLVPPGDAIALADAVLGLLDRPDRRLAMGLAGRARAETMFGLATMLEEIEREVAAAVASR
jgi:glycosyltransferase involved in cell wall biosynthesis